VNAALVASQCQHRASTVPINAEHEAGQVASKEPSLPDLMARAQSTGATTSNRNTSLGQKLSINSMRAGHEMTSFFPSK